MRRERSLRTRIILWVLAYVLLLTVVLVAAGNYVSEKAERRVWDSLLNSELDHFMQRRAADPDYHWQDTQTVRLYGLGDDDVPPAKFARLHPGSHDGIHLGGREYVVLVRDIGGRRLYLSLDLAEFEHQERTLDMHTLLAVLVLVLVLGVLVAWSVGRLVAPLGRMAADIGALSPDRGGQRIRVQEPASAELAVIAEALNGYLERNARFVERERAFVDMASHELRTPIAVIGGAADLALVQDDPATMRNQVERIAHTAREVEQMIAVLLVLAKDPRRLRAAGEPIEPDQWLPKLAKDHVHLCAGKDLAVDVVPGGRPTGIVAPTAIVQAAVANLLRNAIENSDRGRIVIDQPEPGVIRICDPGHGMSPEEISAIYGRMARGGLRDGGGIGLDLIARLCEHLGWRLRLSSDDGKGTEAVLDLRRIGPELPGND